MGRILAVDYGTKRVGLAVTDPLQIIANGLTTVETRQAVTFITNYLKTEKVDFVVVGKPVRLHNEVSAVETAILTFITNLKKANSDLRIEREDERFTSKMAQRTMIDGGLKKQARRNKALVDQISATIILQSYLEKVR